MLCRDLLQHRQTTLTMPPARLLLLYPLGAQLIGGRTWVYTKLVGAEPANYRLVGHWHKRDGDVPVHAPEVTAGFFGGIDLEIHLAAPEAAGNYELELSALDGETSVASLKIALQVRSGPRAAFALDVAPLSYAWGGDRGVPVHRLHLERFLEEHARDIHGRCLEFQEPRYASRFGGSAVERLDILHADDSNPKATIVADLTVASDIPENTFDCIICTHVLHSIFHLERAIAALHRMLAPRGVLLVAVPHISMCDRRFEELWRFTAAGLTRLLTTAFPPEDVTVHAFGNSLTSAGELRGMVASEFAAEVLALHDERFAAEICARAQKK